MSQCTCSRQSCCLGSNGAVSDTEKESLLIDGPLRNVPCGDDAVSSMYFVSFVALRWEKVVTNERKDYQFNR